MSEETPTSTSLTIVLVRGDNHYVWEAAYSCSYSFRI